MELSNDIAASQTAYMQFSVPNTSKEYQNQTVKVSEAEKKGNYYFFKCRVAAKDMNSKITAQLINGDSITENPETVLNGSVSVPAQGVLLVVPAA